MSNLQYDFYIKNFSDVVKVDTQDKYKIDLIGSESCGLRPIRLTMKDYLD